MQYIETYYHPDHDLHLVRSLEEGRSHWSYRYALLRAPHARTPKLMAGAAVHIETEIPHVRVREPGAAWAAEAQLRRHAGTWGRDRLPRALCRRRPHVVALRPAAHPGDLDWWVEEEVHRDCAVQTLFIGESDYPHEAARALQVSLCSGRPETSRPVSLVWARYRDALQKSLSSPSLGPTRRAPLSLTEWLELG